MSRLDARSCKSVAWLMTAYRIRTFVISRLIRSECKLLGARRIGLSTTMMNVRYLNVCVQSPPVVQALNFQRRTRVLVTHLLLHISARNPLSLFCSNQSADIFVRQRLLNHNDGCHSVYRKVMLYHYVRVQGLL